MAHKGHYPSIDGKQVARYVLLPEIMPRIRAFTGSGFGYFAFLIASVYQMVRILPVGHAYTRAGNIGTFGLRDVIAEAANHVKLEWRNIDQIIIFFAIIAAVIILFLQFLALVFLLFSGEALAQEGAAGINFFKTAAPEKDVAFLLLDHVFGVPGFFGSEAPTNTPFHKALHTLFHFYNFAILIIGALIFIYYIVVVVVETAQSGTPFGQRFNSIYAPLRLVIALGLLIPLNYGLNGAQYITLYAAKVGSGFATNGWLRFNSSLDNPLGAKKETLIGDPAIPDISYMVNHMALVHACAAGYKKHEQKDIDVYLVVNGTPHPASNMSVFEAGNLTNGADIKLSFGYLEQGAQGGASNNAPAGGGATDFKAYCGVVNIPLTNFKVGSDGTEEASFAQMVSRLYYYIVLQLWRDGKLESMAEKLVDDLYLSDASGDNYKIDKTLIKSITDRHQADLTSLIKFNFKYGREKVDMSLSNETKARGWGGAGIWYNSIAQMNGDVIGALNALPSAAKYPMVTEHLMSQKRGSDASYSDCNIFRPEKSEGELEFHDPQNDPKYAQYMYHMQKSWSCDSEQKTTNNIFWDAMHMIFGIGGLFDMRCNNNKDVHPLAQLTVIGKGLIDSSVRNMANAMFTAVGGGALSAISKFGGDLSAMGQAASGFFVTMATIGLSLGFLLFYILPFMPFLYFFFAVGAWAKGIFEAMCGAPLWALAHIKIDGEGLPGKSAMNGYFLIFEIFLRPILIVVGLISGMVIFSASVAVLNDIFDTAVLRLTGIDLQTSASCTNNVNETATNAAQAVQDAGQLDKHILDEFFFTVMYAIFVYMIAMSCFKMIDLIPNNILRFMGGGVGVFADEVQDPTDNLAQYAAISGATIGGKVLGGVAQAGQAGGQVLAAVPEMANKFSASANKSGGSG